ncbi:endonuclease/exonuclease/phosphatase family protein [Subtercola sp. PAMC28395]|uniref:endonuclease/exonuclease/phosphatase family protein n=1 Tax=Subtercola sp. PAMC28395 TaxID=2846775 RepID=UPI001C0CDB73|nr:endonuclease/exonuclease/phosphatase family protein [Subtercola sp. PAMC28395]QWT24319.1 endonuclease/exonuclease/phosphatase family protein [Subtercola sp. PAMC28395]
MGRPTRLSRVGYALGWAVAGGLVFVAVVRVWRPESVPLLIGLQGVVEWALLPAYPLAVIAIWRRKRALAVVALALCAVQLWWTAGLIGWNGTQALPDGDLRVRLVTANLLNENAHIPELGDSLAAEGADIVVVQEVTPDVLAALGSSQLWTIYPYRATAPLDGFLGSATFSKFPIANSHEIDVAGHPMLQTDLETPAGSLRLVNVHTVAPLSTEDAPAWARQFSSLATVAAESPFPIVFAGDFNATLDHAPLESLVSGDLRDAFRVAGSGVGLTWPRWDLPIPPLMRLDHVIVSPGITVVSVNDELSVGSDHRHLVVELGLPHAN